MRPFPIWTQPSWATWLSEAQHAPVVFPKAFVRGPTYTLCACGFEGFGEHECTMPPSPSAGTVTVVSVDRAGGTFTVKPSKKRRRK